MFRPWSLCCSSSAPHSPSRPSVYSKGQHLRVNISMYFKLVFTTQSLVLPLCSTDDIGCVPQDMDITDWLNRSDADPNNDKEKHLVINKRKKFRTPILEVCGLLLNVIL